MKNLLQAHGIKVINNQIAKSDVERAINIISESALKASEKYIRIIILDTINRYYYDTCNIYKTVEETEKLNKNAYLALLAKKLGQNEAIFITNTLKNRPETIICYISRSKHETNTLIVGYNRIGK